MEVLSLLRSLQNIMIWSVIVIVRAAAVKSTNVCPHNRTYDLCAANHLLAMHLCLFVAYGTA